MFLHSQLLLPLFKLFVFALLFTSPLVSLLCFAFGLFSVFNIDELHPKTCILFARLRHRLDERETNFKLPGQRGHLCKGVRLSACPDDWLVICGPRLGSCSPKTSITDAARLGSLLSNRVSFIGNKFCWLGLTQSWGAFRFFFAASVFLFSEGQLH